MNPEHWHYIIMGLSGILFALGGTKISEKIDGQKLIRRIALPVILGLILYFGLHCKLWHCIAFCCTSIGALALGYGDSADWWKWRKGEKWYKPRYPKWFTACMIPLPTLFIGFSEWIFLYPVVFLGVFAMQNWTKVSWKIFEFMAGSFYGVCIVAALN